MRNHVNYLKIFKNRTHTGFWDDFNRKHDYLRISVIDKCNFKCNYCYPQSTKYQPTIYSNYLTLAEITKLIKIFETYGGIKKVRLTGDFIAKSTNIKVIGLTTNAFYLKEKIGVLKDSGLTNLNLSLDSLNAQKFAEITGAKNDIKRFEKVYGALMHCIQYKINCVIMKDFNFDEICDFVELTRNQDICVRFIEYMPFLDNGWDRSKLVPYYALVTQIKSKYPSLHQIKPTSCKEETAKIYKVPGFVGTIGFITTMSENFCGTCNRLRLTADGKLKNCIFGNNSLDLKKYLRNGEMQNVAWELKVIEAIRQFVKTKKKEHNENTQLSKSLPMIQIGG